VNAGGPSSEAVSAFEKPSIGKMRVALVAMPWFWAHMPSIQLAIVKDVLNKEHIDSDVFEFYADFANLFGADLYGKIANVGPFLGERLFSQFYFDQLRASHGEPLAHLFFDAPPVEAHIMRFATPLVDHFLDQCVLETNWSDYDVVCLSITAHQLGASIAFSRRLREHFPNIPIVIGGAGCAGEMGSANLELCKEFDIAVHGEAEVVVPRLFKALRNSEMLSQVDGISWRKADGQICTTKSVPVHSFKKPRGALNFDAYFKRVAKLRSLNELPIWIPFESSRGCWYGEKSQCTFCGLNEIIKFRERDNTSLIDELEAYEKAYGRTHFFSVDLIMPLTFFQDFLPKVASTRKTWKIFYEVKSNLRKTQVDLLASSGVRWIQPGIESLNDHVLKLMRKGVSAAHNIQTLRYSAERGIAVSWNLISNFPMEKPNDYMQMAEFFPRLFHLDPPSGIAPFEVHRFSPIHEDPKGHGVRLCGPHHAYEAVFPVSRNLLERLVYRFEYDLIEPQDPELLKAHKYVKTAIKDWKRAHSRQAKFELVLQSDGVGTLIDTRASDEAVEYEISAEHVAFLKFLDELRPVVRIAESFEEVDRDAFELLGYASGIAELLQSWSNAGIVIIVSGFAVSLPVDRGLIVANRDSLDSMQEAIGA
jgi:ribosomal peptide maturation radical SAM protein 1